MQVSLRVPYIDAAAGDLVWAIGEDLRAAVATRELRLPRAVVELRLLGASHQVAVTHEAGVFTETVACSPGASNGLPSERGLDLPEGLWYSFSSTITRPHDLTQAVTAIVRGLGPLSLHGAFPGHPSAVTALDLVGDERSCQWCTWHAYPQTGELVVTRSTLEL